MAISRPMSEFDDSTGKVSVVFTIPASSAPVAVMILNVDPGGCGAENAIPESAMTEPFRAFRTAAPP